MSKNVHRHSDTQAAELTRKQEIKALKKSLHGLEKELINQRRENTRLRQQIARLKGAYGETPDVSFRDIRKRKKKSPQIREQQDLLRSEAVNARRFSQKSYLRYLIHSVKESTLGIFLRRMSRYFRRWRLFRHIATVVGAILVTVFLSAVFITALPFLILILIASLMAIILRARSANRMMRASLRDITRIRVIIFPEQVTFEEDTFAERSALAMADDPHTAVIAVTPRFWSTKGLGGKGMFFTARCESHNLYLVRRGYYFIFRRRVLDSLSCDMTILYG